MAKIKLLILAVMVSTGAMTQKIPTIIRYSDHEPLGNMRTRFLKEVVFKNIERETRGRVKIEDHWAGELSISYDALKTVQEGDKADMTIAVPEYAPKNLPMLQMFKGFVTGPAGQAQVDFFSQVFAKVPEFDAEITKNNLHRVMTLGSYPSAFFSTKPLPAVFNLSGQKWRTASFFHKDFLRQMGAEPVTMPWNKEITTALQENRLDGIFVNLDGGEDFGIYKSARYVAASQKLWMGHVYLLVMNGEVWKKLSSTDKAGISRAVEKSYHLLGPALDKSYSGELHKLSVGGAVVRSIGDAELHRFVKKSDAPAIRDKWAKSLGEHAVEILRRVEKLMGGR